MAAPPIVPTVPNTPLLNRYEGNTIGNTRPPSGPCNYVNVNVGGNAPKCGCRRFTDKSLELQVYASTDSVRPGWCICEHHSCFHNHDPEDGLQITSDALIAEGLLSTPKQSVHMPTPGEPEPDIHMQDMQNLSEVGRPGKKDSLPDALLWNRFVKSASSQGSLPAIPSQCLLPSDNGSRASSTQANYARPFGGVGLDTLNHLSKGNPGVRSSLELGRGDVKGDNGKIMQVYEDSNGNGFLQSLTDVDTPSAQSSQSYNGDVAFNKDVDSAQDALQKLDDRNKTTVALRPSEEAASGLYGSQPVTFRNASDDENLLPKIRNIINHVADYPRTRQNHEHRLDQLENASFTNGAVEVLRDDYELMETRVGDLETRMHEVEKQQIAPSDTNSTRSGQLLSASIDSRSSSALIADAIDSSRIEALESQILELQALAPPTHTRPWEVEVVFIPFGPLLKGIWSPPRSSTTQLSRVNSASSDEWTQTQNNSMAIAQARLTAQTATWENSAADLANQSSIWLMPKACGVGSLVDERLRSRGLVRKILIKGPDARDVQSAMLSAFGDLPGVLARDPYSHDDHQNSIPDLMRQYLGLQAPWIPLRKVHKDSCLRFLSTSEMITPALWTVQFLSSSVAMRSTGVRRLYVTQPDSYIQHLRSTVSWTWQKIRQLARVYPNASLNHTPEADAEEPCWQFDERYDPPPQSVNSSLSSHDSLTLESIPFRAEPASPSDHFSSAPASPSASTTPTSVPPPSARQFSPLKERHPFRLIHTRTISMPSLVPIKSSPSQAGKRRIASFENESRPSPIRIPVALNLKRQRTRSPSRPRDTPRWSVGPPSPYTFVDEYKRGNTPFAYATPHSNAPYIPRHFSSDMVDVDYDGEQGSTTNDSSVDGGERNALSDYDSDRNDAENPEDQIDDEWEGVQDDDALGFGKAASLRRDDDDSDSCPSEYPSTQQPQALFDGSKTQAGFRIHIDDEVDDGAAY